MSKQIENIGIILQISSGVTELDPPNLEEGIDEDRIVEDCIIETRYCPLEALATADGYLRVNADDDFTNVETRIAFKHLEMLGWKKVASASGGDSTVAEEGSNTSLS